MFVATEAVLSMFLSYQYGVAVKRCMWQSISDVFVFGNRRDRCCIDVVVQPRNCNCQSVS